MGVPGHMPPPGRPGGPGGTGHGPFGEKAFKGALVVCCVLVVLGPVLLVAGGEAARGAGTAFLVLGALGLLTSGALLLLEAAAKRRSAPPPTRPPERAPRAGVDPGSNGHAPLPADLQRLRKPPRNAP